VIGVAGPTAIGWFLFKRAQRAEIRSVRLKPDQTRPA
jgi:hypothetical protein